MEDEIIIDLAKLKKPAQFPKDEILDEDDRLVRGWLSVETKDKDGEIIPISELKRSMNTWMRRGGFVTDQHSNRVIGKVLNWKEDVHPKVGKKGIVLDYQIFDDYTIDDSVWNDIKAGKRSLSFGGRAVKQPKMVKDEHTGEDAKELHGIEAYEVASVIDPANKYAENIAVNFLAKGDKKKQIRTVGMPRRDLIAYELFNKPYDELSDAEKELVHQRRMADDKIKGMDIQKPFAGYKNFADCVSQNQDKRDPEAYCAVIMRAVEGEKAKQEEVKKPEERPPKAWWDRVVSRLRQVSGVKDPERLAGWIWYHHMNKDIDKMSDDDLTKLIKSAPTINEANNGKTLKATEYNTHTGEGMEKENLKDKEEETKSKPSAKTEKTEEKEETKQEEEATKPEEAISELAQRIEGIAEEIAEVKAKLAKQDEEEKPTEEAEKPKEPLEDEEKQEEQKLPKAPAGETDETADEESDKVQIMEKMISKSIEKELKKRGIIKSTTPRPKTTEVQKKVEKKEELALELLNKAKKGELTQADMNRITKEYIRENSEAGLREFLNEGRAS